MSSEKNNRNAKIDGGRSADEIQGRKKKKKIFLMNNSKQKHKKIDAI